MKRPYLGISTLSRGKSAFRLQMLACIGLFLIILSSCQGVPASQASEPVRVGLPTLEQNALLYIADDQQLFHQNGLEVTIHDYDTGVSSLNDLLQDKVDVAVAAEFPVIDALLKKAPIQILASVDKFENDFIVGRKDHGIQQPADLKGKRIGVALKTINEFYLGRFLELHQLKIEDVTLVNLKPAEFVSAIANGQVDAIIAWQPYIQAMQQQVKDVVVWPAQSNQHVYGLLVARKAWLAEHPNTVVRLLKSLVQAEDTLARQPQEAQAVVQKRLNYTAAYVTQIWPDHDFALTLDNSLIVAMTDEARWLIRNHLSAETQTPEFYDAIYLDGLRAVKPEALDIHR